MVRRVFFSFHYERDNWRANQVTKSWVTHSNRESAGYIEASDWEKIKREGDEAIKRWINDQLKGASVTAVLIGAETYDRRWVNYEIEKSFNEGKGLVGIRIHRMKDKDKTTDPEGKNPFDNWYYEENGKRVYFSEVFDTYGWKSNNGRDNIGTWVEEAAQKAGR